MGCLGASKEIGEILPLVDDSDESVRWSAVWTLAEIGDETVVQKVITALSDEDIKLRERTMEFFRNFDNEKLIKGLHLALASDDKFVREKAAAVLEYYEPKMG